MSNKEAEISIHPLPVLNISDHCTRTKWIGGGSGVTIGALLGVQSGRVVEVVNSFELKLNGNELDTEYLSSRLELFKQVFPEFELIGWYTQGSSVEETDTNIHKELYKYTESPLLLLMDTQSTNIQPYLSVFDVDNIKFIASDYSIQTTDIERITVDDIHKSNHDAHSSSLKSGLNTQINAIKLLSQRVDVILNYLRKLEKGEAARDNEIISMIHNIHLQLPASAENQDFNKEFIVESNDTQVTTLLASLTSSTHSLNTLINKFGVTNNSHQSLEDHINTGMTMSQPSHQAIKARLNRKTMRGRP
ncbi:hypothetical protein E3P99_01640 [Wallemia hederae]|uniref:COP9 signalosome complex subunit 6 n=1 Tax=Wallemia hederae TaxID=1540922 RepID=A0A4T0FNR8_9BASI|nr:hypothetical protein E3P99_01640 [Wallemia hederae]